MAKKQWIDDRVSNLKIFFKTGLFNSWKCEENSENNTDSYSVLWRIALLVKENNYDICIMENGIVFTVEDNYIGCYGFLF